VLVLRQAVVAAPLPSAAAAVGGGVGGVSSLAAGVAQLFVLFLCRALSLRAVSSVTETQR